jgi:hypothetical protein
MSCLGWIWNLNPRCLIPGKWRDDVISVLVEKAGFPDRFTGHLPPDIIIGQ